MECQIKPRALMQNPLPYFKKIAWIIMGNWYQANVENGHLLIYFHHNLFYLISYVFLVLWLLSIITIWWCGNNNFSKVVHTLEDEASFILVFVALLLQVPNWSSKTQSWPLPNFMNYLQSIWFVQCWLTLQKMLANILHKWNWKPTYNTIWKNKVFCN